MNRLLDTLAPCPVAEKFDVTAYQELLALARQKSLLLVVQRTNRAVQTLLGKYKDVPDQRGRPLTTFVTTLPKEDPGATAVADLAAEALDRTADIQRAAIELIGEKRAGFYCPLSPEEDFHNLMRHAGAYFFTGLNASPKWDPLAGMYLDRSPGLLRPMKERLEIELDTRLSITKMGEIGGFLLMPKSGLPRSIDRSRLLVDLMTKLQNHAWERGLEVLVCAVNEDNSAMHRQIRMMQKLNSDAIHTIENQTCPKDGTPSTWYVFDLTGEFGTITAASAED